MHGLEVVARLGREKLAQESRGLRELEQSLMALRDRIRALDDAAAGERQAAAELADGHAVLAVYLAAVRERRREAEQHLRELERARDARLARVLDQRLELERLRILIERRLSRERRAMERHQQKVVDELVSSRARWRR